MPYWETLTDRSLWLQLGILVAVTLATYLLLSVVLRVVSRQLAQRDKGSQSRIFHFASELLRSTSQLLIFAFALMIGLKTVDLSPRWESAMSHGWFIALAFQIALWLDHAVKLWTDSLTRDGKARNPVTTTLLGIIMRLVIWTMMLLSILANLGVDITAMIASLGVGGIAIALAVQTLLSDMFASMSIGIDKPFEIGDFIVFGDVAGTIEHIGLKTTRIRSLSGEQIVIANAELLGQIVHNYKRMNTRRIVFTFGISYHTPVEKVREIGAQVKRIIEGTEKTQFDRAHFFAFDESRLTFEVVHIVQTASYNEYMDIQQEINLELMETLRNMEVEFAFPIRRVEFIGGDLPEVKVAGMPEQTTAANASPYGGAS
ncbi:mechanosensitive ion channel family protein [Halopseudomonas bauzanensis]|uniref:mechanosensitive ion channel family protein n=1 Tax=Halopseudomonas bauzanensis TaxID=653930 RepID=UPI0025543510|nr:mechanosensitive ion channel family protein [Halopseudomonas bauzanensis]